MGVPILTITSEGQELDSARRIVQLEVRRDVNRIPEADITLVDGSVARRRFELSDATFFEPGKRISIAVRDSAGTGEDTTIFEGRVVRHAVESRPAESLLRVELKDEAFKLTRQRKSAVFRHQADEDVMRRLIGDAELQVGELASTEPEHDELVQFYASDWDFLVSRAEALGLVVDVDRGKVSVRSMISDAEAKAQFEHGMQEVEIALELDASEQWAGMSSRAWDVQNLEISEQTDAEEPDVRVGNLEIAQIARNLGGQSYTLLHPAIVPDAELSAWANARLVRSRLSLLRGQLTTAGRTDLVPLDVVQLRGVGDRFNGDAVVSGVTQRIDLSGWRTELRLGLSPESFGRQPDIADMLAGGLLPPVHGLHVGVVKDFEEDPLGEHRVKVLLSVLDGEQGAVFARMARPDAGDQRGYVFWPEPGDEVIVGFIHGDPRQAIILGALHGSKNAPPDPAGPPSDENNQRAIVSKAGSVVAFDDDKPAVTVQTPAGNKLVLDDDGRSITLSDQHGNTIKLDENGITLTSAKDFTIDASSGNVVIKGTTAEIQ